MAKGIERLRNIEESIAMTDRQRLMVMQTTELAVTTIFRENWEEISQTNAVTEMIVRRMFNHYFAQKELKRQIELSIIPSASGIFQQAVGTYLRAFLDNHDHFDVYLDKLYEGRVRPDVAVELNGQRLVAVEVKTDLGWQRDYIQSDKKWSARRKVWVTIYLTQ